MAPSTPSRLAAALLAALAAAACLPGCCFNIDISLEPPRLARLMVGGEKVIDAPMESSLQPAAEAVRQEVREAGFNDPWPMLSADGRGLIIEDCADAGAPLLVWDDWTREEPPLQLAGAARPQLISSRHFIFDRAGERWVASLADPRRAAPVDPAFDPLNVRVEPRRDLWAAILDDRLYIGSLDRGIADATTVVELGVMARRISVLEPSAIALVETADGVVTAWDLDTGADMGLRLAGTIEWPWASAIAPQPDDESLPPLWPVDAISVTTPQQSWLVATTWTGGLHLDRSPWRPYGPGPADRGVRDLIGASAYRGIVWRPRHDYPHLGLIPYHAMTPWEPPAEEEQAAPGDEE